MDPDQHPHPLLSPVLRIPSAVQQAVIGVCWDQEVLFFAAETLALAEMKSGHLAAEDRAAL